jgi:[acyl-carrier-protein] S-malonyltransferase
VVANVTAKPVTTVKAVKEELLTQLCNCVQWKASVDYMVETAGVQSFVEFGPGRVLSGLVKRISRETEAISVNNAESVVALADRVGT